MTNLLERFKKPTPYFWKKIGYICLLISTTLGGYLANFTDIPYKNIVIGIVIVLGVIGKLLTDLKVIH